MSTFWKLCSKMRMKQLKIMKNGFLKCVFDFNFHPSRGPNSSLSQKRAKHCTFLAQILFRIPSFLAAFVYQSACLSVTNLPYYSWGVDGLIMMTYWLNLWFLLLITSAALGTTWMHYDFIRFLFYISLTVQLWHTAFCYCAIARSLCTYKIYAKIVFYPHKPHQRIFKKEFRKMWIKIVHLCSFHAAQICF